ncbi:Ig-like domain-containing protein [Pseudidiomarina sediminum]|uniref:Ig-like domain-containing protein n=1 Tax=Pseudidiomarina sediminum TaxID=431675 RepID=UPI001C96009E|nr:Ig-like domain-containing protein [Pseudidiomarina sediminum]MBY6063635.1 hypothetical protein [Pseudidiomarina sediminum]
MRKMWQLNAVASSLLLLSACGGSDSSEPTTEVIQGQLNEDAQWQQQVTFTGTPIVITSPQHGQVSLGAALITYTPDANYFGSDTILIEAGNTRYSVQLDIAPVNDAPTLVASTITVSAGERIEGQLKAADVDGDAVTFSLVEAPAEGQFSLHSDGLFSLAFIDLTLPNQSFIVALNDGHVTVEKTVNLTPAYATNADKSAYYYHSHHSHLKQAEQRIANLGDAIQTAPAYIALVEGYARASIEPQVQRILDEQLTGQANRAYAFAELAYAYDETQQPEKARAARLKALDYYSSYVADNGVENISSSDADFFLSLADDQKNVQDFDGAASTRRQIEAYLSKIGGAEQPYSTPLGKLLTAYRDLVDEQIDVYHASYLESDRERAEAAIDDFANAVSQIGYQTVKSGDFAGQRAYRLAPMYTVTATEYYLSIGQRDKARDRLAEALSYYADVTYDSAYQRPAKPYASASLGDFNYPLTTAAGLFVALYPSVTASNNPAMALIPPDDKLYFMAERSISAMSALAGVLNGGSIDAAIAALTSDYQDDLRELQQQLTESAASANLGAQLAYLGDFDGADRAYQAGLEVLTSAAYAAENGGATLYMTGSRGCLKFVAYYQKSAALAAPDAAASCEAIASASFSHVDGDVSNLDVVNAHLDAAYAWQLAGNAQQAIEVAQRITGKLDTLFTSTETKPHVDAALSFALIFAQSRDYDRAFAMVQHAVAQSQQSSISQLDRIDVLQHIALHLSNAARIEYDYNRASLPFYLRSRDYNHTKYASWLALLNSISDDVSMQLVDTIRQLSAADQIDQAEETTRALARLGNTQKAEELVAALPLGTAEYNALLTTISQIQAYQDDFPTSAIASVDTDDDGRANFLAVSATQEQLDANEVATDDDADNDGVEDAIDPTPLG